MSPPSLAALLVSRLHRPAVPLRRDCLQISLSVARPYHITRKVSATVVCVMLCQDPLCTVIVHIDSLKPYVSDDVDVHLAPLPTMVDPPPRKPPYSAVDDPSLLDAAPAPLLILRNVPARAHAPAGQPRCHTNPHA